MKILFFLFIIILLGCQIFLTTDSFMSSFLGVVAFLVVWFIAANVKSIIKGSQFREFFQEFGVKERFPEDGLFAEGYMYLHDDINVAGVSVNETGIYVYSYGICECKIMWGTVKGFLAYKKNSKEVAKVIVARNFEIVIPWLNEFDRFVPDQLMK